MTPRVSVIIPTYNRRELLIRSVTAVLHQTVRPFEVVVVDDGSTDGTQDAVDRMFGSGVTFVPTRHTGLPAHARNVGLDHVTGTHVAFCDSDDVWLPEKLEAQLNRLSAGGCNVGCSDALVEGVPGETYLRHYVFKHHDLRKELHRENFIITSSVLLDRHVLGTARFDTRPQLRGYEDYHFWLALSANMQIDFCRDPLLMYRKHEGSLSSAYRQRDARQQLQLLFASSSYLRYPLLWGAKLLRYAFHAMR